MAQCFRHWSKRALSMMVKKNTAKGGSALGGCISRSLFSHLYLFSTYGSMVGKKRPPKNNLPLCSTKHWQSRMQDWNRHSALTGCTTPGVFPLLTFTSLFCGRKWGGGSGEIKASKHRERNPVHDGVHRAAGSASLGTANCPPHGINSPVIPTTTAASKSSL